MAIRPYRFVPDVLKVMRMGRAAACPYMAITRPRKTMGHSPAPERELADPGGYARIAHGVRIIGP